MPATAIIPTISLIAIIALGYYRYTNRGRLDLRQDRKLSLAIMAIGLLLLGNAVYMLLR